MKSFSLLNARVIDPAGNIDTQANLYVSNGVMSGRPQADAPEIDASGLLAAPGFIDLYGRLRQPGYSRKGTIASEGHAALAGGFTTVLCAPDTNPVIDSTATVELIKQRANDAGGCRVVPIAALTTGLEGERLSELATLFEVGCPVAGNADKPIRDTGVLLSVLEYAASFDIPVFITPLDPGIARNGCAHAGAMASRLGLPGITVAAETVALAAVIELCRATGARVHLSRLSSARAIDLVRHAKSEALPITADVGINHLFFTDAQLHGFDVSYHNAVPFRSSEDRNELRKAVSDGTIDVICSDHAPHDADSKLAPFPSSGPGLSVYDTFLPLLLALPEVLGVPLSTVLSKVTCNPASVIAANRPDDTVIVFGGELPGGELRHGDKADIVVFDPDAAVSIDTASFRSMGHNSPLHGLTNLFDCTGEDIPLRGRVRHSFVAGAARPA